MAYGDTVGSCAIGVQIDHLDGRPISRNFHRVGFPSILEWILNRSLLRPFWRGLARGLGRHCPRRLTSSLHLENITEINQPIRVERISGCFFLLSRSTFDSLGLFDLNYFLYVEVIDYLRLMKRASLPVYYCPSMRVFHLGGASSRHRELIGRQHNLSYLYYYNKWHGTMYTTTLCALMCFDLSVRYVINTLGRGRAGLLKHMTRASLWDDLAFWGGCLRSGRFEIYPRLTLPGDRSSGLEG